MIEGIPLEAIKYPTPNVIKKTGFDLVEVRIGDKISLKLLPNKFVTNVIVKAYEIVNFQICKMHNEIILNSF